MLIPVSEKKHYARLKEKNIVIEEHFWDGENNDKISFVRATDGLRNDTIISKKKKEKRYFLNNDCIFVEKNFAKNVEYTIISGNSNNDSMTCPNCNYTSTQKEFFDGCPFCGTEFNIDYKHSEFGFSDFKDIYNGKIFKIGTIALAIFVYAYAIFFMNVEWYSYILMIVYFPFIIMFSYFIFGMIYLPIFIIRLFMIANEEKVNMKFNKIRSKVYADINTELLYYLYDSEDAPQYNSLIDFDIVNWNHFSLSPDQKTAVADVLIRKVFINNKHIKTSTELKKIKVKKNEIQTDSNKGVIKCKNCNSSISLLSNECEYCKTPNKNRTLWSIQNIKEI